MLNEQRGTQNNIYTTIIHLTEFKRIMQMDNLIYNLNDIKRKEDSYIIDFANIPNFDLRKKEIINRQINFIDKNLNLLNDSLVLIQHLYDFMLMNNIDKRVRNKIIESKDYMNFLEIRGCYFLYIDNKSNKNDIFDCLSDRKFAEINTKKFSNLRMCFLSKPIITRKNEIKKVETSKEKSSNNRVNALSNNNSIDQNDVNNKTAYHFMPKSRSTGFKKQMNSYKSSQLLKVSPDPFFLTNAFTVNNLVEQKNLKRTNSQENINSEFKLVDAVTNTFNTLKTKEKIMPKTQTKFSINDDKLKNFCRDLLKMKETKTDKVSAHSGFISSTVQIEKEKPPLIPTKQAKSISSNFKTKIKSSDEFMNQEEKEIKKYYKYLSVLNKIHNLFILGSTRVDTPFNKRYRLYQELKCKDVIRTIHSSNTINEANSSPKEVFRHNKPLSIPYNQKLQKIRRSTIHKNDKPGIHIPGLSKVEIKSKFNGNKIVENTFYRNDFKEKKESNNYL